MSVCISTYIFNGLHPPKINMEPEHDGLEDDVPFQMSIFRFHVNLPGCTWFLSFLNSFAPDFSNDIQDEAAEAAVAAAAEAAMVAALAAGPKVGSPVS